MTNAARDTILTLLSERPADASVCPSEAARILASGSGDWREAMPIVHAAVDRLLAEGLVRLSWKGRHLSPRQGPYRIRASNPRGGEGIGKAE